MKKSMSQKTILGILLGISLYGPLVSAAGTDRVSVEGSLIADEPGARHSFALQPSEAHGPPLKAVAEFESSRNVVAQRYAKAIRDGLAGEFGEGMLSQERLVKALKSLRDTENLPGLDNLIKQIEKGKPLNMGLQGASTVLKENASQVLD